ncbi:MAG TPA: hypothetical protein VJJ55_01760 [Candidatus Paceibacterota bacterium]
MTKILCSLCQTEMKLHGSIEGGVDVVERYACLKCGRESYLGKFTFRPMLRQASAGESRQKLFHCPQCDIRTAGIVLDVRSECRWCPLCHAPLFQYEGCDKERLEKEGIFCPTCHALNLVKEAKPQVDERSSHPPRGGAWNA